MAYSTVLIGLTLLAATVCGTPDPSQIIKFAANIMTSSNSILGASVSGVDSTGVRGDVTVATGFSQLDSSRRMQPNIAVRAGPIGELLQDAAILQLVNSGTLPQLDETIPSRLMPGGLTFVNPAFPGQPMTLRMLMTHTSSLQDSARFDQSPSLVASSSSATDIRSFAASYFLTTTSGATTIVTDIWTSNQPGAAASYKFARTNIALLMYVLQLIIAENPQLTAVQTVGSLVQEKVGAAAGLTNTYSVLPDGTLPRVQTAISSFSGGKQQEPLAFPNHAAYLADYMTLTSANDLARLAYYLFIQTSASTVLSNVGATMTLSTNFRSITTDSTRGGVVAQGLGIVKFSQATLCSYWKSAGGSALSCPFNAARDVYGYVTQNDAATVGFLCQKTLSTTITVGTSAPSTSATCVAATLTRSQASNSQIPVATALALIGEAFNQLQQSTFNSDSAVGVVHPSDQLQGAVYALSVFGILLVVIGSVFLISYLVEFIVRPMALTGPVVSAAYPKLDEVVADEDESSPLRLSAN